MSTLPDSKRVTTQRDLSLHAALGNITQLRVLLKRSDLSPNQRDHDGDRCPLHWAAARGHSRCVEVLLAAGANLEQTDASGHTAAALAAQAGHDALAFRMELGPPVKDEKHGYEGLNLISLHAALDQPAQLKQKLAVLSPSLRDSDGDRFPLHWAAARGHAKCAEILIKANADVLCTNREGHTPASLAFASRQHATYKLLVAKEEELRMDSSNHEPSHRDDVMEPYYLARQ